MPIPTEINALLQNYNEDFSQLKVNALGNGHINTTYKVSTSQKTFVLQKINHHVFTKTTALFSNTDKINQHLITQKKQGNYPFSVAQQIPTKSQQPYCKIGDNFWRLMEYIPTSYTIETVNSAEQAAQVASAFAHFSCALTDFDAKNLTVMIDNFHDINARLKQLQTAVIQNNHARLSASQHWVNFCFKQSAFVAHVNAISSHLPLHVTHNDTKINNLLFNHTNKPCAVIDLDTCMPGYLMYDFGDMVRTCCSNLAEDDPNINNMKLKLDVFQALSKSYQTVFTTKITREEKQSLNVGARLLPLLIGIRFLTDYLNGDTYFSVSRKNQNLDRAINQLHLYKLLSQESHKLTQLSGL